MHWLAITFVLSGGQLWVWWTHHLSCFLLHFWMATTGPVEILLQRWLLRKKSPQYDICFTFAKLRQLKYQIACYIIQPIVRHSPPRHSPPQTFTTPSVKSDVHHPQCKIRRSPPQTFTTSDVHHPLCEIRRSPPQTFTTSDVHHLRRSPPQTFTTPDVHHPQCKIRRSPPQTVSSPA